MYYLGEYKLSVKETASAQLLYTNAWKRNMGFDKKTNLPARHRHVFI